MRIKICGITRVADMEAAVEAGADAIGLNFVGGPREIAPGPAEAILTALPPFVTPVALVRLEGGLIPDPILELLAGFWVSHLQLYGPLAPELLRVQNQDGFRPMPAVAVRDERFADQVAPWLAGGIESRPAGVVLDAYHADKEGGTGKTFRWDLVPAARSAGQLDGWPPIVLAGGLRPDNVAEAVRTVRPFAVDVSSGVEVEGAPGTKDPKLMRAFVRNARAALDEDVA